MSEIALAVSDLIVVAGALFCVVGGIGILRLPDFFSRTHATSIGDTLGAGLVLLGLGLREGIGLATGDGSVNVLLKLLLLIAFIYLVSPTATHALAKAAYAGGVRADPAPSEGSREETEHGR